MAKYLHNEVAQSNPETLVGIASRRTQKPRSVKVFCKLTVAQLKPYLLLAIALTLSACLTRSNGGSLPALGGPAIFFSDVEAGPTSGGPDDLGVPIAIFGKGFGAQRGTSTVTIGGLEVAKYLSWGQNKASNSMLDMIVVQPGSKVSSGPMVVKVNGKTSNSDLSFSPTGGKVYFVAPAGSDSAPCSINQPCIPPPK